MGIDPEVEAPTRRLIGHAVRGELDKLADEMTALGPDRFPACLGLCLRIAGYIAIDVSGCQWPSRGDLREIAQRMAAMDADFDLEEPDVYDLLARAALGFEPLFDVFPDKGKAATVPVLATASLLVAYRTGDRHWWEYLDVIERALEQAAPLPRETAPAVLLLTRYNHAAESGQAGKARPERRGF